MFAFSILNFSQLKNELAKIDTSNNGFGSKIVGCVRGLWGTRLTENVAEDKERVLNYTV